jgi:hypothetical protein
MDLGEKFGQATDQEIQQLERRVGALLPADYREFLRTTNGMARLRRYMFSFVERKLPTSGAVQALFTLAPHPYYNLEQKLETFVRRYPPETMPIGTDPGGNLLCIVVTGPKRGEVWFWDHEQADGRGWEGMSFVARTFDSFLEALYV